jgi:hypothetical protein
MRVARIVETAWDGLSEDTLLTVFINRLQEIVDSGGTIISVTVDKRRKKVAFVLIAECE